MMIPFDRFPPELKRTVRYVLTDIDDTLTTAGRLPAVAFAAMERLRSSGLRVVPVTGRPAGWCDHIARMWPVDAVVGENGAFYFRYDDDRRVMTRRYWRSGTQREIDQKKLERLKTEILNRVPGSGVSADQAYREADLAIDYCEDVATLSKGAVADIVGLFEAAGAQAKVSSIHVNGWFGSYDKLSMTRRLFEEAFNENLDAVKQAVIFVGDSPNDVPMFAYFPNAVGVANVAELRDEMDSLPAWVTTQRGGQGFAEMAACLLA